MKKIRFKMYVGTIILLLCFFVALSTTIIFYLNSKANLMNEVVDRLRSNITMASKLINTKTVKTLSDKISFSGLSDQEVRDVENSSEYRDIYNYLNKIRDANPNLILYIYILVPDVDRNFSRFLVDADVLKLRKEEKKNGKTTEKISSFNLRYNIANQPVASSALYEKKMIIEKDFVYDKDYNSWSMMGFAPIWNNDSGEFLGIIGMDISNKNIDIFLRKLFINSMIISFFIFLLALIVSLYVTNTITKPVLQITDAVKTFGNNNFSYRADINSTIKEIENLTINFNQMADNIEKYNNEREKAAKESQRRLKITEVYTRRSLVDFIAEGGDPTKYQPENRRISVLFSDIRDFTEISENLTPMNVVGLLNKYFDKMNGHIMQNKGEIDKLIGDCIMAAFKTPDDSVVSAIEMRRELEELNISELPDFFSNSSEFKRLNNGIGINYGTAVVGNIGSNSKMDYTLIGDIVNTASRLESLTKYYGVGILISEDLKNHLKIQHQIRPIDLAIVKGKKQPITIYEVYDYEDKKTIKMKNAIQDFLDKAFDFYIKGEFEKSQRIYEFLIKKVGPHKYKRNLCADPVLDFYLKRVTHLKERRDAGLLKDWTGVYEFKDK